MMTITAENQKPEEGTAIRKNAQLALIIALHLCPHNDLG
jgi:hypothetical protein